MTTHLSRNRLRSKAAGPSLLLSLWLLLSLFDTTAKTLAAEVLQPTPRLRITIASNVRLRSAPSISSEEMARLGIGTVVRELEQSGLKEMVGNAEDFWYRVVAPDGKEGWVFGALTQVFEQGRRVEAYKRIAAQRLKVENPNFADSADLFNFLTRAVGEASTSADRAELELSRLLALHQSFDAIPVEKLGEEVYQTWVKAHENEAAYSEPAGKWLVRAELLWNLQKKYAAMPVAERIAWEASQIPLPGECEGYIPCYLYALSVMEGRYLRLYPRGAHAPQAVNSIHESLEAYTADAATRKFYQWPSTQRVDRQERAGLQTSIAELRAAVQRTNAPKRLQVLKQLDTIARLAPR